MYSGSDVYLSDGPQEIEYNLVNKDSNLEYLGEILPSTRVFLLPEVLLPLVNNAYPSQEMVT